MTVNFFGVLNHKDAINVERMYDYKKKIRKFILVDTIMVIEQQL